MAVSDTTCWIDLAINFSIVHAAIFLVPGPPKIGAAGLVHFRQFRLCGIFFSRRGLYGTREQIFQPFCKKIYGTRKTLLSSGLYFKLGQS